MQDPNKREMLLTLGRAFQSEEGWRDEAEIAIYYFAEHNYSGQGSNLYLVLSMSYYQPGRFTTWKTIAKDCGLVAMMYEILGEKYAK